MRQKVYDYIAAPSKKLKKELTSMELKWAETQTKKGSKPEAPKDDKKPAPKK